MSQHTTRYVKRSQTLEKSLIWTNEWSSIVTLVHYNAALSDGFCERFVKVKGHGHGLNKKKGRCAWN